MHFTGHLIYLDVMRLVLLLRANSALKSNPWVNSRSVFIWINTIQSYKLVRGQAIEIGNYWSGRAISSFKNPSPPPARTWKILRPPCSDPKKSFAPPLWKILTIQKVEWSGTTLRVFLAPSHSYWTIQQWEIATYYGPSLAFIFAVVQNVGLKKFFAPPSNHFEKCLAPPST